MNKLLIGLVLVAGLAGVAFANCGNGNGNGNGCSGNQGPQGPAGQPGSNGLNGSNGSNGVNGATGASGVNGAVGPAANSHAAMIAGLQVRLFDTRYVSLFAFDDYQLDAQPSHDLIGGGAKNNAYGARLMFKLGRDYTEDRIDTLNQKIQALEKRMGQTNR